MTTKSSGKGDGTKLIVANKRARYDYFIDDTYEAGIVLTGTEVKSLRGGKASLAEAWVRIDDGGQAWLMQAHIAEYPHGNINNHHPTRERKLLLHRHQLDRLAKGTAEKGYGIVPMRLYFRQGKAKLEIGLGRGKAEHDKRQSLKEKQAKREIDRALKQR
ncbi:MAG TPA: SsrA-binding protein SmpB [Nitriliruptorales bacterium]